jgi:hypothetical protein
MAPKEIRFAMPNGSARPARPRALAKTDRTRLQTRSADACGRIPGKWGPLLDVAFVASAALTLHALTAPVVIDASFQRVEKLLVGSPSSLPLNERLRGRQLVLRRSVTKPLLLLAGRRRRLLAYPFVELLVLDSPNLELVAQGLLQL